VAFLLGLAFSVSGSAEKEPPRSFADWSEAEQSIQQLTRAYELLRTGDIDAARVGFAEVESMVGAPEHQRWEARQRIQEIERRQAGLPAVDPMASRVKTPKAPVPAVTFHVAPGGSDTATGTEPFASLEQARDAIRQLKRADGLPVGGVAVVVHGGEYQVVQTFELREQDSGTAGAPIIYRSARGETPRFRGGVRLSGFVPVTDGVELERLPASVSGQVWRVDLGGCGVTNLLPLKLGGFASGHGFRTHPAHELFVNGKAMQLARGPNTGFLEIKDVVVKDGTKGYDREGSKVGRFFYEGDRPGRWVNDPDLLLYGYWFWDWADSYETVTAIDPKQKIITLAEPYHRYGYSIGAPFYAINARSELDAPGEWYLDRATGVLYLYPTVALGSATVELSRFAASMVSMEEVSHVRLEGLTWELGSADALQIRGGAQCLIAGCTIRRFVGNGVTISGGTNHGLLSTDVYSMGRGGVVVSGGNRRTLAPGRHFVENCEIHELSRIDHTYTPAVVMSGVGNRIVHNSFHDISSSAMRVGGNDHVIEYNEVYRAVLESDDQGGADMYGNPTYRGNVYRFNYWHQLGTPYGPLLSHSQLGQAGIRLDDAICGTLIYGNVFEHCSSGRRGFGGVQIHGGKENIVDNNLFVDGRAAISCSPWSQKRWTEHVAQALDDRAIDKALYLRRYPALANLDGHPNRNAVWRSAVVRCEDFIIRDSKTLDLIDNTVRPDNQESLKKLLFNSEYPGFALIPFDQIGLYGDDYR